MSQENEPRGRNNPRKQQPALDTTPHQVFFGGLFQDLFKAAQGCAPTCPAYGAAGVVPGGKFLTFPSWDPCEPQCPVLERWLCSCVLGKELLVCGLQHGSVPVLGTPSCRVSQGSGMASFTPLSPSVHHFGTCPCSAAAGSWQALCQGPLSNPLLNLSGSDPYLCAPAVTKLQQLGDVPGRTRPDFTAAKTSPCFRSR